MRKVLLLLFVVSDTAQANPPTLIVEELAGHAIRIDTPFETVELDPAHGGRVRRLTLKSSGNELTWWGTGGGPGGLLGAPGDWMLAAFTTTDLVKTSTRYAVSMSADSANGVRLTKTLRFNAETPVIEATYRIENRSAEAIESGTAPLLVQNVISPVGTRVDANDIYSLPMSEGVIHANSAELSRHPDTADAVWTRFAENWGAIVNRRHKQGVVMVFEDDAIEGLHAATSGPASTFDWTYRALERGHALETTFLIAPVAGVSEVQHANDSIVIDVSPDAIEAIAVSQQLTGDSLLVRDLGADGHVLAEYPTIDLGTLSVAVATRIPTKLPPRATGTVIREFHVSDSVREIAEFRDPTTKGVSRALQRAPQTAAKPTALPDASSTPFIPSITDLDRQRGFAMYEQISATASQPITELNFDLAPELRDSRVLGIWPLTAATEIPIVLEPAAPADAAWLADHVLIRSETQIPAPKDKRGTGEPFKQLWPVTTIHAPPADQETRLWITIRGRSIAVGDYAFALRIGAARVPVHVKVWPVKLPARPRVNLEMEHAMLLLPGSSLRDGAPTTLDLFLNDLSEHGVNTAQIYPAVGNTLGSVTLKGTGETLSHALRERPKQFERGPFPELDFSNLDPWVDAAVAHGMTRVTTNYGDVPSAFRSDDAQKWYLRELRRWVIKRGFKADETYIKVLDEVLPPRLMDLAHAMSIVRAAGWKPFSTFSTVLRYPIQSRAIAAVASVWQFAGWPVAEYMERTAAHDVPTSEEMWTYIGRATAARTYQAMRSHGWEVAVARLDGFHGHEYFRWPALAGAAIVTIDKDHPIDSPAWEGMAEGIADGRLLAELIHRLDGGALLRGHLADAEGAAASVVSGIVGRDKRAIVRVGIRRANGMEVVTVLDAEDPATIERYRAARRAVLEKLAARP